jgi:hypothetical protein
METPPAWLAAAVVVPSLVVLALLALLCYLCCSKKYKLNWWERNLITQHKEEDSEKQFINHMHNSIPDISITVGHGSTQIVTHRYVGLGNKLDSSSSSSSESHTPAPSPSPSPMGSRGSSPVKEHASTSTGHCATPVGTIYEEESDGSSSDKIGYLFDRSCRRYSQQLGETLLGSISPGSRFQQRRYSMQPESTSSSTSDFWVPPSMVEKKRAQSLIPSLGLLQQSQEGRRYKVRDGVLLTTYSLTS